MHHSAMGAAVAILFLLFNGSVAGSAPPVYAVSAIVKNEKHVLPKMLASVLPYVKYYAICDTGSTDGTDTWAEEYLRNHKHLKGAVYHDDWENFMWNRNQCLQRVRTDKALFGAVTHILFMDADFELTVNDVQQFVKEGPPFAYNNIAYDGPLWHRQPLLISVKPRCGYITPTHEYLICVDNPNAYNLLMTRAGHTKEERKQIEAANAPFSQVTNGDYDAIVMHHSLTGSNRADKFARDVEMLQHDILEYDDENPRTWFYLARSLEDGGEPTKAFTAYYKRVFMSYGERDEEAWYSAYRMGVCLLANGTSIEEAARYFIDAFSFMPWFREPLYFLARYYREKGKYGACRMFGYHAMTIPMPKVALFVEKPVYEWLMHDELSMCLGHLGEREQAALLIDHILKPGNAPTLDPVNRKRIQNNRILLGLPEKTEETKTTTTEEEALSSVPAIE